MEKEFENLLRLLNSETLEQVELGCQIAENYQDCFLKKFGVDAGSYIVCKRLLLTVKVRQIYLHDFFAFWQGGLYDIRFPPDSQCSGWFIVRDLVKNGKTLTHPIIGLHLNFSAELVKIWFIVRLLKVADDK